MFGAMKWRWFLSGVMAEIKAQYDNQQFVDAIMDNESLYPQLHEIWKVADYRKNKEAPFLDALYVLAASLESDSLNAEQKGICASLLAQRLNKAKANPSFHDSYSEFLHHAEMELQRFMGAAPSMDQDEIVSSEYSNGRYKLISIANLNQTLRGKSVSSPIRMALLSDDLKELETIALVKKMSGVEVQLIDTATNRQIPI